MQDQLFSQECPLCLELAYPGRTILGMIDSGRGRVLASTSDWALMPSLGAIREHHLMLVPFRHYRSVAYAWGRLDHTAVLKLLSAAQQAFSTDAALIFEHGEPETGLLRTGACVDHAHLHILPGYGYLADKIVGQVPFETICLSLEEAMEKADTTGYQLVGAFGTVESEIYLRSTLGPTPSQFLRRLVADAAGAHGNWDWRSDWNLSAVEETCHVWRNSEPTKSLEL